MVCLESLAVTVEQDSDDSDDNDDEGVVMNRVCKLACSHMFHFRCVSRWLSVDHRCPVCRYPMPWIHAILLGNNSRPLQVIYHDQVDNDRDTLDLHHRHHRHDEPRDDPLPDQQQQQQGIFTKIATFLRNLF